MDTINTTVPGKNPKVYHSCFTTDVLTQSEAVSLGRLAKVDELSQFGREVTIFRLFDGKTYDSEDKINLSNGSKECDHVTGIHSSRLFNILLVHKLDRFARNRYDSAVYKRELKKNVSGNVRLQPRLCQEQCREAQHPPLQG